MAIVRDKSGNNPNLDNALTSVNRKFSSGAANDVTPLFSGEIIGVVADGALNLYKAMGLTSSDWAPATTVVTI